jgi:hypothetical protein
MMKKVLLAATLVISGCANRPMTCNEQTAMNVLLVAAVTATAIATKTNAGSHYPTVDCN